MKELETPPADPVDWKVQAVDPHGVPHGTITIVKSRTWYQAREDGARVLGVDRYRVTCKRAAT